MQNRPFCGLVYRKLFFRDDSLSRIVVITLTPSSFLCLAIGSTSHAAPLTVTFLLTFKIMGDFWPFNWVRIWRLLFLANIDLNDYILVTGYKLWVQNGLSHRLPIEGIFFKTTFNFRRCHCCKVLPSIGRPMDRRYFNRVATSTIFFKNFSTNFFFRLYFGLSRCLPIRGTIFRKP